MKLIIFLALLFSVFVGLVSALFGGLAAVALFMLIFPALFILRDYRVGVVGILLLLPLANITLLGHIPGLNPANVLIALTFGGFILSKMMGRDSVVQLPTIIWWRFILPIGLALMVGLAHFGELTPLMKFRLGDEFTTRFSYVLALGIKPLLTIMAAWLIGNAVRESKHPERYLAVLVASALMLALVLLGFIVVSGQGLSVIGNPRARGFLSPLGLHANEFGAMFATAFAIMLFMLPAVQNAFYRLLLLGVIGLVLAALLLTFSRGGYVTALVVTLYFMFTQRRVKLALGAATALVVLALAAPQAVQDRIMLGFGGEGGHDVMSSRTTDDELTAGRMWMWRQTFPAFYKNPVIGSGIASQAWSDAVKTGVVHTAQTHNLYLSILYDTGLVGCGVILSFFVFVYRNFKTVSSQSDLSPLMAAAMHGSAAALLGYALMAFTNGRFWPQTEQVYLWFMFGVSLAYMRLAAPVAARVGAATGVRPPFSSR